MNPTDHDSTSRGNGRDTTQRSDGGLVRGVTAIALALFDASERLSCRAIEASARVVESLVRASHAVAGETIEKTADVLQHAIDAGRETIERAIEAAGSTVESAGRLGERAATSVSETLTHVVVPSGIVGNGSTSSAFHRSSEPREVVAAPAA
jgi:hypothetical protein